MLSEKQQQSMNQLFNKIEFDSLNNNLDTVDRTRCYAKLTARALAFNHGMHVLGGTDNCINGAGLNTQCAANAVLFDNAYNLLGGRCAEFRRKTGLGQIQQVSQLFYGFLSARGATIDVGFAGRNRLCIRATARVSALGTLCLWQQPIDFLNHRGRVGTEAMTGNSQCPANRHAQGT